MKKIKSWVGYFFNGVKIIANNKIAVIAIFCLGIFLLNRTLCYKEEIDNFEKDDLSEKVYKKLDKNTKYYYEEGKENSNKYKNIAASDLISCINKKVELSEISGDINSVIDDINELFNESDDHFSFLYKDIYTGFTVSYNADAPIFTATTIKAPAMIYLYEMASEKKIDLKEELVYDGSYYSESSGVLKDKKVNTKYSVEDLISYSIKDSDNIAYYMLMKRFGRNNMLEFWKKKGTKNIFTYDTIWGVTSANDAGIYMEELYNFYKNNDEYGNKLMDYFKQADWKIITNKNLEFNTANKGGWSDKTFHDIAIVFEDNPYILAVMSNTGDNYDNYTYLFDNASKLAGELHSKYWEYKINECEKIKQY